MEQLLKFLSDYFYSIGCEQYENNGNIAFKNERIDVSIILGNSVLGNSFLQLVFWNGFDMPLMIHQEYKISVCGGSVFIEI